MIEKLDREKIIEEMAMWGNLSAIGQVVAKQNELIEDNEKLWKVVNNIQWFQEVIAKHIDLLPPDDTQR